jgi:hypothetical protein
MAGPFSRRLGTTSSGGTSKAVQFVTLLLFSLVTGVFWGTWFSLSRSMAARAELIYGNTLTHLDASIGPFGRTYGENLGRKVEDWLKKHPEAREKVILRPATR